jgi:acetyl esterase/lipase
VSPRKRSYGSARSNFAELFCPDGPGPHPVAVVIHGGFWKAHYGRRLMHPVCEDLAARGWAAWNLEYRRLGLGNGGGFPTTLEDVAAGIDALADVGTHGDLPEEVSLDLGRVVAIGHSAGGHLALWAAGRPSPRVAVTAVVGQAAVSDLRLAWDLGLSRGIVARFLGGAPDEVHERCAEASPAERLPLRVPALLVHGGRDDVVPPVMSERFAAASGAELRIFEREDHMGHIVEGNPMWEAACEWIR